MTDRIVVDSIYLISTYFPHLPHLPKEMYLVRSGSESNGEGFGVKWGVVPSYALNMPTT